MKLENSLIVPQPTPETKPYWDGAKKGRLVIQVCEACEVWNFPPRLRCPICGVGVLGWEEASGEGRLWSYTIIHRAEPEFSSHVPYVLAVVELKEGPHIVGTLATSTANPEELPIDAAVHVDFEARGNIMLPIWRLREGK